MCSNAYFIIHIFTYYSSTRQRHHKFNRLNVCYLMSMSVCWVSLWRALLTCLPTHLSTYRFTDLAVKLRSYRQFGQSVFPFVAIPNSDFPSMTELPFKALRMPRSHHSIACLFWIDDLWSMAELRVRRLEVLISKPAMIILASASSLRCL